MEAEPSVPGELDGLLGSFDFAAAMAVRAEEDRARWRGHLVSLLEVMDAFDRLFAFLDGKPAPEYLGTVYQIARRVEKILHSAGVAAFPSLGAVAEPGRHEILAVRESPGAEDGSIIEEVERGYECEGQLLRKAGVIVAGKPAESRKES